MPRSLLKTFTALLMLALFSSALPAASPLSPQRLRSEYLVNPIGIDAVSPRLSWVLSGEGRGRRQTAYQIVVGSSEAEVMAGRGDLWDSGKVSSAETNPIVYAGPPLPSATRAWWKVRVWDENDQMSAWSAPAFWETGLFNLNDWHGKWIARSTFLGGASRPNTPPPLLRRTFTLDGAVKQARAYIVGLGYFELSLNGQRVGDHLLDPGYTRYDRRSLYVTHDVTAALQKGENVIGVMLGNGWFNFETLAVWFFDQAPWRATPRLLLELRVEYVDGRTATISSDETWKTSDSPITFSSVYSGEYYDARLEQTGWDKTGFNDTAWSPALLVDAPKGKLAAQAMHPIRLDRVIKPLSVKETAPGVYIVDAGQNLTGNAELKLAAPAGTTLTLRYSENLTEDGKIERSDMERFVTKRDDSQSIQVEKYTFRGDGVETWHSRFTYHGFRYIEVTGAPGKLMAENFSIRSFYSDVPLVGEFTSSNPTLNKIWAAGRWSYLTNLFGIPTDCPHREKNGWTGDAHIAMEQGLFYADGITVYEKWIDDVADEQFINGALPGIIPTSGQWGYQRYNGPAWDSAFLLVPWYLYEYYGDDSLLRANYEGYKKYVDYLTTRANDGIVAFGLGDWAPWKTITPVEVTDTGYYYRDARIVATVAGWLGKTGDAKKYNALADSIKAAFNEKFYDPTKASYSVGSQTALGTALYQELVEPENEARVTESLIAAIAKTDHHLDFGLLGSKYVLNALSARGHTDVAYAMATQKTQPSWGWWMEQGATTLWEQWNGTQSHNHTFLGDVNAWMIKSLAGIQVDPTAPGFQKIIIAPNPVGDLTSAKAHYDSVRGRIASEWSVEHGVFKLTISIPANTVATVVLPAVRSATITEGGQPLEKIPGMELLSRTEQQARLQVGSGDYVFSVRQ